MQIRFYSPHFNHGIHGGPEPRLADFYKFLIESALKPKIEMRSA